jgi:hypothetical protein
MAGDNRPVSRFLTNLYTRTLPYLDTGDDLIHVNAVQEYTNNMFNPVLMAVLSDCHAITDRRRSNYSPFFCRTLVMRQHTSMSTPQTKHTTLSRLKTAFMLFHAMKN